MANKTERLLKMRSKRVLGRVYVYAAVLFIFLWTIATDATDSEDDEEPSDCGLREVLKDDVRTLSPWTVSIFVRRGEHRPWEYLLAGTILNPTTILTLYGGEYGTPTRGSKYVIPDRSNVKVAAGLSTTSLSSKDFFTQEASVSYISPFMKHRSDNKVFHLYLIHLSTELKFDTPFVKAVCLQEVYDPPDVLNDNFYLGGYAPLNPAKGLRSMEVKKINLLDEADCKEEFQKSYKGSSSNVLCGRQSPYFPSEETCILHGATLVSSADQDYRARRENLWYLTGILAMIPSLKTNQCDRDTLYMVTNMEDSLRWIRHNIHCGPSNFTCNSGHCIPLKNVCDGIPNCASTGVRNSNDESAIYCTASNPCKSSHVYFHQCGLFQECIAPLQICDGRRDCENGADENPGVCALESRQVVAEQEIVSKNKVSVRRVVSSSCHRMQLTEGVIATCKNVGNNQDIPCNEAMVNDEMTLDCDAHYKPTSRATTSKMKCTSDGTWKPNRPFYCERECGIIASGLTFKLSYAVRTTNQYAFPWYVALFRNNSNTMEFICGGSLIEPKLIISAAHCVVTRTGARAEPSIFQVIIAPISAIFSENKNDAYAQIISINTIRIPPTFNLKNLQSDIAILELRKPVTFNDFVLPICYLPPFYTDYPTPGIMGKVAGLGYDETNQLSAQVKYSDFPVVGQDVCAGALGHILALNTFCAGYQNGTAVCKGDSGGGLVFPVFNAQAQERFVLKGIVSHGLITGNRICDPKNFAVFTHVDAFSDWISSTVEALSARRKRFDPNNQN